jgi:hypothetical protein
MSGAIATGAILCGSALGVTTVNAQEAEAPLAVPPGYQVVQQDAWAFVVPDDWQATEISPPRSPDIQLVAQMRDSDGQVFVNLVTEPFDNDSTQYLSLNLETMRSIGFEIHRQEPVTIGNINGGEIESTLPSEPPVRALQRVTVSDGTGYAITCGSLESQFETVRSTCEAILNSFQVSPAN